MQFEHELRNCFDRLLETLPNKFFITFWAVLILLLFFNLYANSYSSQIYSTNTNSCIIASTAHQNSNDARQSNSGISIFQVINFNRIFQLNLLFNFRLPINSLIAITFFYLAFSNGFFLHLSKFFYQMYIKSSIPCRASPLAGKGDFFTKTTQTMVV